MIEFYIGFIAGVGFMYLYKLIILDIYEIKER